MKANKLVRMMIALILALMLVSPALAELKPVETKTDFGSVTYPVLTDYEDEIAQINANLKILEVGQVEKNLDTLSKQNGNGWGMEAGYAGMLESDLLSIAFSVRGDLGNYETQQRYDTLNMDLLTGEEIGLKDLFLDEAAAIAYMETLMEEQVAPQLSGYAVNENVSPLPKEKFTFNEYGITFYYEGEQFLLLSGYGGTASFFYYELEEYLNLEEGSVLDRLKVSASLKTGEDSAANIQTAVKEGTLPGVYAKLGDTLSDVFKVQRLFCDPDYYPNARFYQLEAGEMRSIYLLAPLEKKSYDETLVTGIRADRFNFYGIRVGKTTREEWQKLLGQPDETVDLDAYTATDFYLNAGMDDYYHYGENRLRLHANEEGVLESLQLLD